MPHRVNNIIDHGLLLLGTATGTTGFLVNADLALGLILKLTGIASFIIHIIINRKKIIKNIKEIVSKCPDEDKISNKEDA